RSGEIITFAQPVREYTIASLATLETVANRREALWANFADYRQSGVDMAGNDGPAGWVVPAQTDQGAADRMARLVAEHGSDVYQTRAAIEACGLELGVGSYIIPGDQPSHRQLRMLLDPQIDMDDEFLVEQERLRARGEPDQIYDVTGWSLPIMFNVAIEPCRRVPSVSGLARVDPNQPAPGQMVQADATLAYLAPGGSSASLRLMAAALREGLKVDRIEVPLTLNGEDYPSGSLVFQKADNPDDLADTLAALVNETGATVSGTDTSWTLNGPNFGSMDVVRLHAPRVALAWDRPTDIYSPGAVRFVLERQFGYPVTVVRTSVLRSADLNRYDVVVLPNASARFGGGYDAFLGTAGAANLRSWVQSGGTLVTLAGGTVWAARPDVNLLASRLEHAAIEQDAAPIDSDEARVDGLVLESMDELSDRLRAGDRSPDSVSGVLVNTEIDTEHWLAAGVSETVPALVRGNRIFTPPNMDRVDVVARYASSDELLASGYLWEENRLQLAFKPYLMTQRQGRGLVVSFSEDPAVRGYLEGLNGLLVNAVLVAPSYSFKLR
ncbi:MAG: peptidase M14, partial [Pseudomonadota bacterium]